MLGSKFLPQDPFGPSRSKKPAQDPICGPRQIASETQTQGICKCAKRVHDLDCLIAVIEREIANRERENFELEEENKQLTSKIEKAVGNGDGLEEGGSG